MKGDKLEESSIAGDDRKWFHTRSDSRNAICCYIFRLTNSGDALIELFRSPYLFGTWP
jgi:hypothetical protein